ncbi:MAG: CoA transferase [Actinomycetia bacterium]|nr:CoA transferase [Actinomycetes bacterium]MCP4087243.1 CoA transferase [Actinomycetes bacterium]
MTGGRDGILAGVKVVELAQNAAVPHCGRLLAGLGADVVKVEPPQGDAMRHVSGLAPNESRAFAVINPGKRGITVDLGSPSAGPVVDALFAWADVALVAFKLPDLARYGIDWEHARTINPRLVHLTHSPMGPKGPDADLGGYDPLVQGRSGLGFMMNRAGATAPQPTRPAINDFSTGFTSAFAVMAGLRHRDLTGEGQRVDSSLLGTAISLGTPVLGSFPVDREALDELDADLAALQAAGVDFESRREVYDSRMQPAGGAFLLYFRHYQTADGLISVGGMSQHLWTRFHEATGLPRPTTSDPTEASFVELVGAANELFATRPTAEWLELLRAAGYPASPYHLPHEAVRDPQVMANDFVVDLEHPTIGPYRTTGMPVQFEKAPASISGPSPGLGEHTLEVMAEIGFDQDEVRSLVEGGTIRSAPVD